MTRVKMIQQVEQLSDALRKCDNSWVPEQIVMQKIKNKRDNLYKKLPDSVTMSIPTSQSATPAQGRPKLSASSSFNSTSSTVPMDEDDGNYVDDVPQTTAYDDVASDTSFQTATVDLATAAARRDKIKSTHSTTSHRGRGARGGRGRGAKSQSMAKTQALAMTQSFIGEVPVPMERKPSWKARENQEVEDAISAKRKAEAELQEGRAKIAKKSRANLEGLFKKWAQETGEVYEEVEREVLWLGGVKFLGTYEGGCQIWKQAEPDGVEVDDESIED
jgi:hypothetical protein